MSGKSQSWGQGESRDRSTKLAFCLLRWLISSWEKTWTPPWILPLLQSIHICKLPLFHPIRNPNSISAREIITVQGVSGISYGLQLAWKSKCRNFKLEPFAVKIVVPDLSSSFQLPFQSSISDAGNYPSFSYGIQGPSFNMLDAFPGEKRVSNFRYRRLLVPIDNSSRQFGC